MRYIENKKTKKQKKTNIITILLSKKYVNNYTKLLLFLNKLNYKNDYYIPNKKLINCLKISRRQINNLLKQLEEDKTIEIYYENSKRYFKFNGIYKENNSNSINNIYDYSFYID